MEKGELITDRWKATDLKGENEEGGGRKGGGRDISVHNEV